jgi:hypothetical protein
MTALMEWQTVLLAESYEILQDVTSDDLTAYAIVFFVAYSYASRFHHVRSSCAFIVGSMKSQLNPERNRKAPVHIHPLIRFP